MHPGRCAQVAEWQAIGFVGELHPKWRQTFDLTQAPVMFELDLDAVLQRRVAAFKPLQSSSPFSATLRWWSLTR
jgi:phenylalanyl-tRNA synthetase beta chain